MQAFLLLFFKFLLLHSYSSLLKFLSLRPFILFHFINTSVSSKWANAQLVISMLYNFKPIISTDTMFIITIFIIYACLFCYLAYS